VGCSWSAPHSQICTELKRLASTGTVVAEHEAGPGSRPRSVYTITRQGSDVLRDWLVRRGLHLRSGPRRARRPGRRSPTAGALGVQLGVLPGDQAPSVIADMRHEHEAVLDRHRGELRHLDAPRSGEGAAPRGRDSGPLEMAKALGVSAEGLLLAVLPRLDSNQQPSVARGEPARRPAAPCAALCRPLHARAGMCSDLGKRSIQPLAEPSTRNVTTASPFVALLHPCAHSGAAKMAQQCES